jgi:hypothetical protein
MFPCLLGLVEGLCGGFLSDHSTSPDICIIASSFSIPPISDKVTYPLLRVGAIYITIGLEPDVVGGSLNRRGATFGFNFIIIIRASYTSDTDGRFSAAIRYLNSNVN